MKRIVHPASTPQLNQGIKWSFLAHLAVFLILILKSYTFPDHKTPYSPSLKVDLVALPDLLKKEQERALSPAQSKFKEEVKKILHPTPRSHEMTVATKSPSRIVKNKHALQRLKALARIQNWAEEPSPNSKPHLIKGNQLSAGTSTEGEAKESNENSYLDSLRDRLHENFQLPIWLSRQPLSAQVHIFIAESGDLLRYVFENPSGNIHFDSAVKKAIQQSQPFPTPPLEMGRKLMSRGISFRFPL